MRHNYIVAVAARPTRLTLAFAAICATRVLASNSDGPPQATGEISAMIKAGLPVFEARPGEMKIGTRAIPDKPRGAGDPAPPFEVVRMSPYVTREKKPLTDEIVLNEKGVAFEAMDRYLGGLDTLDRGFLNAYTLPELWSKIPILGALPFAGPNGTVTNEERAMRLFRAEKRAEILKEFSDFVTLGKLEGTAGSK
jgi:hypothetical protein